MSDFGAGDGTDGSRRGTPRYEQPASDPTPPAEPPDTPPALSPPDAAGWPVAEPQTAAGPIRAAVPGYLVRWGIPSSVLGLGVFIAALVVGIALYVLGIIPNASAAQFTTNVLGYGALFGVVVLVVRLRGSGSLRKDLGLSIHWVDLALGLGAALVAKAIAVFFGSVAQRLAGDTPVQGNLTLDSDTFWIVLNALLFACLLGPFVEEVFFRGMVLRGIRNRVLRTAPGAVDAAGVAQNVDRLRVANTVAIIVSAAVFAALHLYESSSWASALALGGSTFFLGLINARLAVSTGRLGAGIVAHILFNASSVVLLLALG
ncbi:CPBP family intramembrane glutamic endopeptidase [Subtercola endophyticus]|uniref:CPBP family intramembrane glutamic endopeptidase n=1 Tax=Subtercola endophyticus TaxID=2895559 RepID=UPI001E4C1469|nr:type II CAAX endopeptidase family protein [Subtercola endophyticus]UFS57896.1 CPBP family intramembrane metalloprotease [Subtercola endophyticus]